MAYGSTMVSSKAPKKKAKGKKKSFPDMNKDGKITKADVLMGRGVIKGKKKDTAGSKAKGLTTAQENKLKEHSKHHSSKHISMMRKDMKNGMSFTKAHNKAQKAVGK